VEYEARMKAMSNEKAYKILIKTRKEEAIWET
jgi:hypothetical protein